MTAKVHPTKTRLRTSSECLTGIAPVGKDGKPLELHYEGQNPNGQVKEMTQADNRGGGNFKKNLPNTGQQPSQIDRNKFKQDRKKYWKDKAQEQ